MGDCSASTSRYIASLTCSCEIAGAPGRPARLPKATPSAIAAATRTSARGCHNRIVRAGCAWLMIRAVRSTSELEFPPSTVPIECDEQFATLPNGNPDPSVTGYPFIVTVSGIITLADDYCNIGASFVDRAPVNVCAGAFKFVRDWTIIDWCTGEKAFHDQVIKVLDS